MLARLMAGVHAAAGLVLLCGADVTLWLKPPDAASACTRPGQHAAVAHLAGMESLTLYPPWLLRAALWGLPAELLAVTEYSEMVGSAACRAAPACWGDLAGVGQQHGCVRAVQIAETCAAAGHGMWFCSSHHEPHAVTHKQNL